MKIIKLNDNLYPKKLLHIQDPPSVLYAEGNIDLLNSKCIAIIGSRNASENGKKIAAKFSTELSSVGITIISGLALGIDTFAHTFSYKNPGKTIAVLGCGFNKLFPPENTDLYNAILENNGLIISEYPPDEESKPGYFIKRNRIISGLSLGLLVVEAFYRSGTSVTARLAQNQGREVFTVPHEIWDSRGVGTNRLLKKGAKLVTDSSDILQFLNLNIQEQQYIMKKKQGFFNLDYIFSSNTLYQSKINKSLETTHSSSKKTFTDSKQSKIYEILSKSGPTIPKFANSLAHETGFSVNEVLSVLFLLEIGGHVKKIEGGYICT